MFFSKSILFFILLLLAFVDSGAQSTIISKSLLKYWLKKMCKEGAYWGTIAGVYVGMEYGMERVRGHPQLGKFCISLLTNFHTIVEPSFQAKAIFHEAP
ncbi:hypothetical protein LOK49_LG12G02560 [Camellia lanceoleosa]|uniref:Uncharacterized protein n=1 Tax=Camellia lanceoleosa TaxID=1840588 RepID=A0ACC0FXY2_9ERIC|nr:hypothetical protein LOK49_LG12G02560 [Camellia lanceoleosa]